MTKMRISLNDYSRGGISMETLAKYHKIINNNLEKLDDAHNKLTTRVQKYAYDQNTKIEDAQAIIDHNKNNFSITNCFYKYDDKLNTLNIVCLINVDNNLELNNTGIYECDEWIFEKINLN